MEEVIFGTLSSFILHSISTANKAQSFSSSNFVVKITYLSSSYRNYRDHFGLLYKLNKDNTKHYKIYSV